MDNQTTFVCKELLDRIDNSLWEYLYKIEMGYNQEPINPNEKLEIINKIVSSLSSIETIKHYIS